MCYALVEYNSPQYELMSFDLVKEGLVAMNYPDEITQYMVYGWMLLMVIYYKLYCPDTHQYWENRAGNLPLFFKILLPRICQYLVSFKTSTKDVPQSELSAPIIHIVYKNQIYYNKESEDHEICWPFLLIVIRTRNSENFGLHFHFVFATIVSVDDLVKQQKMASNLSSSRQKKQSKLVHITIQPMFIYLGVLRKAFNSKVFMDNR
ncbi:hypothetical protein GQX74_015046 [Glossina fuscipes]|nr:hypothetical protein GQX74_015046 [Glossina fuscipes]